MSYNILIGGAAGQGVDTMASILEKALQRSGYEVFSIRDYMSRVRGGHNFIQVRFGISKIKTHTDDLDTIVALNQETVDLHKDRLKNNGLILHEEGINIYDKKGYNIKMKLLAKETGNLRTFGSVALGAIVKLYDLNKQKNYEAIKKYLKYDLITNQNIAAFEKGYNVIDDKNKITIEKGLNKNTLLINGNEAIALGALAADCRFYSAYPMTPSTSIMDYLSKKANSAKIIVEQTEDEIAAINMAIGASYAGVRSMTGTSGGGFSLMVEAFGLTGILELPLVIAEVQRPGPATGLPTRTEQGDLKFIISASQGEFPRMVIAVRSPQDAFYQTIRAFNIADIYQIPVVIMSDQYLADSTSTIEPFDFSKIKIEKFIETSLPDKNYKKYELTENGISRRIIPGSIEDVYVNVDSDEHDEDGFITESAELRVKMTNKRLKKLQFLMEELCEPEVIGNDPFDILLVGWGSVYSPLSEAVELINSTGIKCQALVFGDIWPLPEKLITTKAKDASIIVNVEQNATGQLASIIREVTGIKFDHSILKYDGRQISAMEITSTLKEILARRK